MRCEFCDHEVQHERQHYKETLDLDGLVIWECTGWTCDPVDWRARALAAESKLAELQKEKAPPGQG